VTVAAELTAMIVVGICEVEPPQPHAKNMAFKYSYDLYNSY
jgi:hypothetical protein